MIYGKIWRYHKHRRISEHHLGKAVLTIRTSKTEVELSAVCEEQGPKLGDLESQIREFMIVK